MQKLQQLLLSTLISAAAIPASLHAQAPDNYPAKPVVIVIPYEGDGTMDTQLRMYMQAIQESAGKQFLLDHKGGGGTTVGTGYVARAAPDGYTLLAVNAPFVISPAIYPDLPYDNVRDFAPIAMLTKQFFHLTVHPSAPYRNVKEFIDYARSHPGELNFGTSGLGGATHLPGELLHYLTRTRVTFVHYKQPSQRMLDLMAGRLQATFVAFPTGVPLIKSGKIRAIGVTSLQRSPGFPDVPTIAEEVSPRLRVLELDGAGRSRQDAACDRQPAEHPVRDRGQEFAQGQGLRVRWRQPGGEQHLRATAAVHHQRHGQVEKAHPGHRHQTDRRLALSAPPPLREMPCLINWHLPNHERR